MPSTPQVFKVALPGYNAETDTDPNHFSLYVDQSVDYVLLKEKSKATVNIANSTTTTIPHNLTYVPFCLVFVETSAGVWRKLFSVPLSGYGAWFEINDTNLLLKNFSGGAKNFAYHIFYDNIT